MKALKLILGLLILGAIVAFTTYFNYASITEAYGSGPPHYSQTTNMDKWRDPWPILLIVDVIAVALVGFISVRLYGLYRE